MHSLVNENANNCINVGTSASTNTIKNASATATATTTKTKSEGRRRDDDCQGQEEAGCVARGCRPHPTRLVVTTGEIALVPATTTKTKTKMRMKRATGT